jgi:hypothetical protein
MVDLGGISQGMHRIYLMIQDYHSCQLSYTCTLDGTHPSREATTALIASDGIRRRTLSPSLIRVNRRSAMSARSSKTTGFSSDVVAVVIASDGGF